MFAERPTREFHPFELVVVGGLESRTEEELITALRAGGILVAQVHLGVRPEGRSMLRDWNETLDDIGNVLTDRYDEYNKNFRSNPSV